VRHWLLIPETTLLATTLRPYHWGAAAEIRSQRKVLAFDTGFVACVRWAVMTTTALRLHGLPCSGH
jgi:hypothetical protein